MNESRKTNEVTPISLTTMGATDKSLFSHSKKYLLDREDINRKTLSAIFAKHPDTFSFDYTPIAMESNHVVRFEELGKGLVEFGMDMKGLDELFNKCMRQDSSEQCKRVTQSHKRIFLKAIQPLAACFISEPHKSTRSEQDEFTCHFEFTIIMKIVDMNFEFHVRLDSNYCDYILESFGESQPFDSEKIESFIQNLPISLGIVLGEKTFLMSEVSKLSQGDEIFLPFGRQANFVVANQTLFNCQTSLKNNTLSIK